MASDNETVAICLKDSSDPCRFRRCTPQGWNFRYYCTKLCEWVAFMPKQEAKGSNDGK